ncbi:hypothetical protein L7F22_004908 [Adiantum nelumboides]|nr:hypothetical protein [Adiantum nelumboides]
MMDVLVNKELAAPLKERKEGAYNDQLEELDARARATIWLHLGESFFFTIMDKTLAFKLWDSLCSSWDDKSASNKVFLMKKLMHLSMKDGSSVSSHLNEFNALYLQLTSKGLNFNDEMKAIFLLCSLPMSWNTFNTAISNSTHGGKLALGDVTSGEEIRQTADTALGIAASSSALLEAALALRNHIHHIRHNAQLKLRLQILTQQLITTLTSAQTVYPDASAHTHQALQSLLQSLQPHATSHRNVIVERLLRRVTASDRLSKLQEAERKLENLQTQVVVVNNMLQLVSTVCNEIVELPPSQVGLDRSAAILNFLQTSQMQDL